MTAVSRTTARKGSLMSLRLKFASMFVLVAAVLAACSTPPGTTTSAPLPPGASGKAGTTKPGVSELGDGRVVASGWVARVDLEGGFWAVMDASPQPPESSYMPQVVAVILPGAVPESEFKRLEGSFIGAEGVLQTGASIRMSGPEVVVDAVRMY
jgi:hypothetical protein